MSCPFRAPAAGRDHSSRPVPREGPIGPSTVIYKHVYNQCHYEMGLHPPLRFSGPGRGPSLWPAVRPPRPRADRLVARAVPAAGCVGAARRQRAAVADRAGGAAGPDADGRGGPVRPHGCRRLDPPRAERDRPAHQPAAPRAARHQGARRGARDRRRVERSRARQPLGRRTHAVAEPARQGARRLAGGRRGGDGRMTPSPATAVAHRGMITVSIMLATIMQALDTTIANVALPHMQGSLQASQDQITWVLTSYIVASAITLPLTGWLCTQWGRRKVFIVSVIGFTVASALCGLSTSLAAIVAARLLQGVFGAALVPLSQAVLLDINPPQKVGQAMAIWGAGIMVGPILGPMMGGWLTENFDWRCVFFINLPAGLFALWGIVRYLPENKPKSGPLDMFGLVTLSIAIGALQMFLDRGELLDWFDSWEIRIEAAAAVVSVAF